MDGNILTLKIRLVNCDKVKSLQFQSTTIVYDALKIIREKIPEAANINDASNYGLFIPNSDLTKGIWLENGRTLDYYMLKNEDTVDYRNKFRQLQVRLLDGQIHKLLIDDSQIVSQLMIDICSKIGISNYEEYSLINDINENEKEKTATLKKDKTLPRDHKKMEELKKKLHTDDDIPWLDHSKTLRQQGIDENSKLILKRKFFFSDKNIDTKDPIQLRLLYVQCRDAIINGTHPIKEEEAIKFAAIQCQVEFKDYNESTHKSGFLDLKKFLPKEYVKVKGIEKKIFAEYKQLKGLNELDAQFKYTQQCRSLKTYGVTFFLVKEKMKGKNKLVARLLGVSKESIIRVDEKTKEFTDVYPLDCVKKWAASPNTFTLDFGDHYKEPLYTMQTTEGENIARLIAGYIDIIMKKKKAKEFVDIDGDEESPMLEEIISPSKATMMQLNTTNLAQVSSTSVGIPGLLRNGQDGSSFSSGNFMTHGTITRQAAQASYSNGSPYGNDTDFQQNRPQRAFLTTVDNARRIINIAQNNLQQRPVIGEIGNDPASLQWKENLLDVNKQNVTSHISAMNAATAQVVTLTSDGPANSDYNAVGAAVSSISTNLGDFSKDVMMIAALHESSDIRNDRLLLAAKNLCNAFGDFLRLVEPDSNEPRQNLFSAVSKIGEASNDVIRNISTENEITNQNIQEGLITLAKAVASSTAGLVISAKNVASHCDDQQSVNQVISLVTQCAISTSQLISCTKVCASTISNSECQEQIVEAARVVSRNVDSVVDAAVMCCNDALALDDLKINAKTVYETVTDLLDNVRATNDDKTETKQDESIDRILNATDSLFNSMGDAPEMIRQAKVLAQATTELVNSLKQEAMSQSTSDQQRKLLHAAKLLAEATSKMVEAAKGCATNPQNSDMQRQLRKAAEDLRSATTIAAGDNLQLKLVKKLETSAKQAASCATQSIAAVQICTLTQDQANNNNNQTHAQLIEQCKVVADSVPRIVQGIRGCMVSPESRSAHLGLINSCEDFVHPAQKMIGLCQAVLPTISDEIKAIQLRNCTKQLANALADLKACLSRAQELCGSFEAEAMLDTVNALDQELTQIRNSAISSILKPLPGETLEICENQLGSISKTVGSSMAQMLTAAAQKNEIYTGIAAKDTINALRILVNSIRGIVACSQNNYEYHEDLIQSARGILREAVVMIQESEKALLNPNDEVTLSQQRLTQIAKSVSQALYDCVNCLPGQREIDESLKHINESSKLLLTSSKQGLSTKDFPHTNRGFSQIQSDLNHSAVNLNQAANEIVIEARRGPKVIAQSSNNYSIVYDKFIDSGLALAGKTEVNEERAQIVHSLRDVFSSSSKLLQGAKQIAADPQASNIRNQLALAAKNVTDSINSVISLCLENNATSSAQKQCDNALRDIETLRTLVTDGHTNEPVSDLNYYDCLEQIFQQSKHLAESITGLKMSTEQTNLNAFIKYVKDVSQSICGIVEASIQSSYLIGVSDASSRRGKSAILDTRQFINASRIIQESCDDLLLLPPSSQQQLIQTATLIAHTAAALCNSSREASSKTNNTLAKRHFVQSAKQVANATAHLVKCIKRLDNSMFTQDHYNSLARPLIEAVDYLCQYALTPEFSNVPAIISETGMKAQEPILNSTKVILDSSCELLTASKSLIGNSKDPNQWQKFSSNSKAISESIKKAATYVKEKAPAKFECDRTLAILDRCTKIVEGAILAAVKQSLEAPIKGKSLQVYQEQAINSALQIMQLVDDLKVSAKFEAEKLGHVVLEISNYFEPLVINVIGCASKSQNSQQQMMFLEQTKTVLESTSQLLFASKENAGNSKNLNCHHAIDENAEGTKEVLDDLIQTLEESTAQHGYVSNMVDNLTKAISKVDHSDGYLPPRSSQTQTIQITAQVGHENDDSQATKYGAESVNSGSISGGGGSFVDYQTKIVQLTKLLQKQAQDLTLSQINELGLLANQLTHTFNSLTSMIRGAIQTCSNRELECRLRIVIQELGKLCIDLVRLAGQYQNKPNDKILKKDFLNQIENVNRKSSELLLAFEANLKGTQACIHAASSVNVIISDLDTVTLFATSGTLTSELEGDVFNNHRESILTTAKALVEDTKLLVTSAANSQEELSSAAHSAVRTISKLADTVKLGAAALGCKESDAQVLLINAVKDVAIALNELIISTKLASSQHGNHESEMENLKESAKNMVANVHSLLKTVKTVEDEAARGTRALESAIEAVNQEMKNYTIAVNSQDYDDGSSANGSSVGPITSEDLIRAAKQITLATSKTVSAGTTSKQEDLIVAANMGRKAVSDLLTVCRGSLVKQNNDDRDINPVDIIKAGYACAHNYRELLNIIHSPIGDNKQRLLIGSKNVASAVSDLVQVADRLKDGDLVDPDDPAVIAEYELLGAANAIEAAARKLAVLKPRVTNEAVNENLNFDEQILEAAKSITNAASALIKAATAAQKELSSQGKKRSESPSLHIDESCSSIYSTPTKSSLHQAEFSGPVFNDDGQWSQGLISAARMVATACHTLCEAANGLVQGHSTEERLISSTRQVASSTAALLVACKVKAGISSQAMRRLQNAGNAVKRATDALVRSAQQSVEVVEEDKLIEVDSKIVGQQIQEIMLREEILRKEKELRAAQERYNNLKKSRYQREEGSPSNNSSISTTVASSSFASNNNNNNNNNS